MEKVEIKATDVLDFFKKIRQNLKTENLKKTYEKDEIKIEFKLKEK